jgi:NAD(P)-dependent dehydrogenase (short-subunit alcohol dehydrogenase family)
MSGWSVAQIGDQGGKLAVVTGANSGIGFETARALALAGAEVILACRDAARGEAAADQIRADAPAARVEVAQLDLGRLTSVRAFAAALRARHARLDLLINNAGVMIPPLGRTEDGFELQIGINHLGHFALTGLLLELVLAASAGRVVVVASLAHRYGTIDLDDLSWERRRYRPWRAYAQSKLANLLHMYELQRRLEAAGAGTLTAAAHPGWTATNLQQNSGVIQRVNPLLAQTAEQGAWPTLFAATDPKVRGGDYFGPAGLFELKGPPRRVAASKRARDPELGQRLWARSEALTGVRYDGLTAP